MSLAEKMTVTVSDGTVYIATRDGGENLDRYEAVALIAAVAECLREIAPEEDPRWRENPRREGSSETISMQQRAKREQREARRRG